MWLTFQLDSTALDIYEEIWKITGTGNSSRKKCCQVGCLQVRLFPVKIIGDSFNLLFLLEK